MGSDSGDRLKFVHDNVFEGIWEKYSEPAYQRRIWTLQSTTAFFVMAAFVVLVEFTGSRSWSILRSVIISMKGLPTRLSDDAHSEPLLHLSQGKAIWTSFPSAGNTFVRPWRRIQRSFGSVSIDQSSGTVQHDPAQSGWFGIAAVFNIALFVCLGIGLPVVLTDGAFGAPIVKSKVTEECLTSWGTAGFVCYIMDIPRSDALFRQCFDEVNRACDSEYFIISPGIEKRRLNSCPFPTEVCQNGTQPFEISHMNISAYELGINSRSVLTLNHRLTCAPVVVEKFQLFPKFAQNYSFVSARTTRPTESCYHCAYANYSVLLSSQNGPNSRSNASSGLEAARNGIVDITALPKFQVDLSLTIPEYQELLHEDIQRDDGQSFLIVYRAGNTYSSVAIDDPFFAAHNEAVPEERYYADYEATALGCVEQYQFCIPTLSGSIFCTSWGHTTQPYTELKKFMCSDEVSLEQAQIVASEYRAFFLESTQATSIYQYIALRNHMLGLLPLLRGQTSKRLIYFNDELWTVEVETWFMKSIVNGIFRMRTGAEFLLSNLEYMDANFTQAFNQKWASCGRVLFRDGDYTNINLFGFCATTGALSLICLISYLFERISEYLTIIFELLADPYGTMVKIRSIFRHTVQFLDRHTLWRISVPFPRFNRGWTRFSLYNMFHERRTLQGSHCTGVSAAARTLRPGDNSHPISQTNLQNLNHYDLEELGESAAIDNPI